MSDCFAITRQGQLRGTSVADGVLVWKGIRFASPPTGPHRFALPHPPETWSGIRDALAYGHSALQASHRPGETVDNQDEDCLFLNVWSPSTRGRYPVIVWIHGGAFIAGTGANPVYDGTHYVERDCVLVTINYRLGAFGCLYQPDRPASGNLRLADQMAALSWVQDNIAGFGGDPTNVTVMGESAGAMSIGPLLGIPGARRLFRRAILASGGPRPVHTGAFAAQTTAAVMRTLGLRDTAGLMNVSSADLLQASAQAAADRNLLEPFPHVIDGELLTEHPLATVDGTVDMLIGTCNAEADPFLSNPTDAARFESLTRTAVGEQTWSALLQTYHDNPVAGHWPVNDVLSGWFAVMPSVWLAERAQRAGARVWQYTFDYPGAGRVGAVHGSDVPFMFGTLQAEQLDDPSEARILSSKMLAAFANFASTGDPWIPELPSWPSFTPERRTCLSFDTQPDIFEDRLPEARREAWAAADPYLVC